jgi:hypothetical protein
MDSGGSALRVSPVNFNGENPRIRRSFVQFILIFERAKR